jgi:hypothetical protein
MVAAAHASVATAHASSAATHSTATHASSAPSTSHTVAAATTAGVVAAMVLARVRRVSIRRLIGTGGDPLPAEIHGRISCGRQRQCSQQAKRKNNTHSPILLFVMIFHLNSNARTPRTPTSASEKRGNQT